jgi:chemotaxis protein histidine kinase CheA
MGAPGIVGLAEEKLGIVVDEPFGQQDVVIKSPGSSFPLSAGMPAPPIWAKQKTISCSMPVA